GRDVPGPNNCLRREPPQLRRTIVRRALRADYRHALPTTDSLRQMLVQVSDRLPVRREDSDFLRSPSFQELAQEPELRIVFGTQGAQKTSDRNQQLAVSRNDVAVRGIEVRGG